MRAWIAVAAAGALSTAPAGASTGMRAGVIDHVADGDTVVLRGGETIRLVQIDTPEIYGDTECYGPRASALTKAILPPGTHVRVGTDPKLDQHDRDGRTLGYLVEGRIARQPAPRARRRRGSLLLRGGRYATQLLAAAVAARKAARASGDSAAPVRCRCDRRGAFQPAR